MKRSSHVTRCRRWYELNLAALKMRELYRSGGIGTAILGLFLFRLPGLLGMRLPGGMIFPGEVTVIWDVSLDELEEQEDLYDLGFRPLGAFELPEFSGINDTLVLRDRDKTTYCEVINVRAQGETGVGVAFSSYRAGEPEQLLKTIQSWKVSPLDRPEDFPCQCVPGRIDAAYDAHREWVESFGGELVPTSLEHFLEASARNHRVLMKHWIARGLYLEARPDVLKKHLKAKELKWEKA